MEEVGSVKGGNLINTTNVLHNWFFNRMKWKMLKEWSLVSMTFQRKKYGNKNFTT